MPINVTIDPIFFAWGPLQLGWHGLFSALALAVAVRFGLRRAEQLGLPAEPIAGGLVWAVAGGVIGARLFHVLDHLPYFAENPLEVFAIWRGGIAVYGAFVGGVLAGAAAARAAGLPVWRVLDAAAPAMLVGQAIGRVGCLINGDAWGAPCSGCPFCVVYHHPNALLPQALLGVPTHPYPLYEIGAGLVLLVLLWGARRHLASPGSTFLAASLGYACIRFGLTFFRQETVVAWGLQEAQLVALATGAVAAGLAVARTRRGARRSASGAPTPIG